MEPSDEPPPPTDLGVPTAQERAIFEGAYRDSNPGSEPDPNRRERGGWLVRNPDGTTTVHPFPVGHASGVRPTPPPPAMTGSFHTHPNRGTGPSGAPWDPAPSRADRNWVAADPDRRAPHFVIAERTIYRINWDGTVSELPRSP